MTSEEADKKNGKRNYAAFWIFGFCNHFINIVMLVAAQDILNKQKDAELAPLNQTTLVKGDPDQCLPTLEERTCSAHSAGVVLFCNVFPAFIIKLTVPVIAYKFSYGVRHFTTCLLQAGSLLVVGLSSSVPFALVGVMMSSAAIGLGESTFLALASHYSQHTISFWSSGTGFAGMIGSLSYAGMTDPQVIGLSPATATLIFLIIPVTYFITYNVLLRSAAAAIHVEKSSNSSNSSLDSDEAVTKKGRRLSVLFPKDKEGSRRNVAKILIKYMAPLFLVYFAEYMINQGLVELIVFDCSHGWDKSPRTQYRWYQVVYRCGVFLSRSTGSRLHLGMCGIAMLPLLQFINAGFFLANAIHPFVPHFGLMIGLVLYEGLIGGAAYVNSFSHIHRKVDQDIKEYTLSMVTLADSAGIVVSALTAIPVHNAICNIPYM